VDDADAFFVRFKRHEVYVGPLNASGIGFENANDLYVTPRLVLSADEPVVFALGHRIRRSCVEHNEFGFCGSDP
jgi:hypothetical protein